MNYIKYSQIIWICLFSIILFYFSIKQNKRKINPYNFFDKSKNNFQMFLELTPIIFFTLSIIVVLNKVSLNNQFLMKLDFFSFSAQIPQYLSNISIVLLFIMLIVLFYSYKDLGRSWTIGSNKNKSKLITKGVYSISRNPVYLFYITSSLLLFIINGNFILLIDFLVIYIIFNIRIKLEELELEKKFGQKYNNYKKRVSKFI